MAMDVILFLVHLKPTSSFERVVLVSHYFRVISRELPPFLLVLPALRSGFGESDCHTDGNAKTLRIFLGCLLIDKTSDITTQEFMS
jgi:hypothetical protein